MAKSKTVGEPSLEIYEATTSSEIFSAPYLSINAENFSKSSKV